MSRQCNQPILAALAKVREQAAMRAATAAVYGRPIVAAAHMAAVDRATELEGGEGLPLVLAAEVGNDAAPWLWQGRIVAGTVAILQGDPMAGKSTLAIDLAARITRGDALPLDAPSASEGAVIITGHEDTAGQVRARLESAGAVLERVHLSRSGPALPAGVAALARAVKATGAKLVIMERCSEILDSRPARVTAALAPLADMAEDTGATVLLLRHLTKRGGRDIYRGLGAISASGVARSVLTLDTEDGGRARVLRTITNADGAPAPDVTITRGDDGRNIYAVAAAREGEC
ncbi:AAA family ATPase [Nannocystis pusilla]|uniref:AAA family ATPase n=1 Tax=Nannocystis pusilla TaxID=889268 RepID=UPI003DA47C14